MPAPQKESLLYRALTGMFSLRGKIEAPVFLMTLPFVFIVGVICFSYIFTNLGGGLSPSLLLVYALFACAASIPQAKRLRDIGLPAPLAWLVGILPQILPLIVPNLDPEHLFRQIFWEPVVLAWIVFLAAAPSRKVRSPGEEKEEDDDEASRP